MNQTVNQQYLNSNYKGIVKDINGLYIPFDCRWKKIGISVSGGADSALLSYLLCNIINNEKLNTEVHIISHVRMWKTRPWQRYDSIKVFNYLKNKFPNINFIRHENFIPPDLEYGSKGCNLLDEYGNLKSGDQIIVRSHAEWISYTNNLDSWFSAKTKNPNLTTITNAMPDRFVTDPSIDKLIFNHNNVFVCHPFLYTEKDWIIEQYVLHNILDLLESTRSCEGDFNNLDYTNYTLNQKVPVCGVCFWCQEKNWALEKNNVR